MGRSSRYIVAVVAVLFMAGANADAPNPSKDIITLADRWLGMSMAQFKQAAQITPGATIRKSTLPSGQEITDLESSFCPACGQGFDLHQLDGDAPAQVDPVHLGSSEIGCLGQRDRWISSSMNWRTPAASSSMS